MGAFAVYAAMGLAISPIVSVQPLIAWYWAAAYAAVLIVLALEHDAPEGLRRVMLFNWAAIGALCLAAVVVGLRAPSMGGDTNWYDISTRVRYLAGMPMVRTTGIARYAAVLGLVAFARLVFSRQIRGLAGWGLLLLAMGAVMVVCRSTGAWLGLGAGMLVVLLLRGNIRWLLAALAMAALAVLILDPQRFSDVVLRGKTLDTFLSGRPEIWGRGLSLIESSPWLGYGFHADRLLLAWPYRSHISNAWLHATAQTGLVGGAVFILAWGLALMWFRRAFRWAQAAERLVLVEVAGVLTFFLVRTIFESSGAFFGIDWLLIAPLAAYVQAIGMRQPASSWIPARAAPEMAR